MKHALFVLCIALLLFSMSSCTAYVDGRGYARPGYAYRSPAPFASPRYYSSSYRGHPPGHAHGHWKGSKVKAKVKTPPARVSSATWLRF
jgi:hypothetical protein